jgi:serine/threonine protein kinase
MVRYRRSTAPGCFHESIWDDGRVLRIDEANTVDARNDKFRRRLSLPRRVAWHRERLTLALRQHKNLRTELVLIFFAGCVLLLWIARIKFSGADRAAGHHVRSSARLIAEHHLMPLRIPYLAGRTEGLMLLPGPFLVDDLFEREGVTRDWDGLDHIFTLTEEKMLHDDNLQDIKVEEDDDEDSVDSYYAFDDDYIRSPYTRYDDDEFKNWHNERTCRRVSWHRLAFPTCNRLHELDIASNIPKYINSGAYRQVFEVSHSNLDANEDFIWRQLAFNHYPNFEYFEYVRMDALVSERLTSSPQIVDIYGYCGNSMLSEYFPDGDLVSIVSPKGGYMAADRLERHYRLHRQVKPLNDIPTNDKLIMALQMSESLAWLHGFPDGLLVHDDLKLGQFLRASDGSIKLNDFNRAEAMLWDIDNHEYCKYFNGVGRGDDRSPEEYLDKPIDELIDIYSLGNIFYNLLTGIHAFYDAVDEEELKQRVRSPRDTPFIHPAYRNGTFPERKLVEIMERCFAYEPSDRPSIFEIVEFLRDAVNAASLE